MAHKFNFDASKHTYNPVTKSFNVSEKDVPFATTYELVNPKTGNSVVFEFHHSTGTEFDPKTVWVYTGKNGLTLHVHNDAQMTRISAERYLEHKTGKYADPVKAFYSKMMYNN